MKRRALTIKAYAKLYLLAKERCLELRIDDLNIAEFVGWLTLLYRECISIFIPLSGRNPTHAVGFGCSPAINSSL